MGLFKTKKKTVASTSVSRMITDEDIPDINKMATIDYLFSSRENKVRINNKSVADYYTPYLINSLANKYRRSRKWAKEHYAYGVPAGNFIVQDSVDVPSELEEYLTKMEHHPVALQYGLFGPANNAHLTWQLLVDQYGYNPVTNEITDESLLKNKACYLKDAVIHYCKDTVDNQLDPESFHQHGYAFNSGKTPFRDENRKRSFTPWVEDANAPHDFVEITVCYADAQGKEVTYTIIENFLEWEYSGIPDEDGLDESAAENIDPDAIALPITDRKTDVDYFQACYLHEVDGQTKISYYTYEYLSDDQNPLNKLFTDDEHLGNYLPNLYVRLGGINLANENLRETNEYITSKKLAKKLDLNYPEWVNQIHEAVGSLDKVRQIHLASSLAVNVDDPLVNRYMYEYFTELYNQLPGNLASSSYAGLEAQYASSYAKAGQTVTIGDKATYTQISFQALGYKDVVGNVGEVGTVTQGYYPVAAAKMLSGIKPSEAFISAHYYRKQLTANVYREVVIYGLTAKHAISGGYTTTAGNQDEELLIPIDMDVAAKFNNRECNMLYCKALHIIVSATQVIKKKWYQTGVFKAIMFVAAVVLAWFTGGASLTWYAVAFAVVQTIVISLVVQLVLKIVVVKLGIDLQVIGAVVAVVALIYGGYLAINETTGIVGVTATQMVSAANYSFMASNYSTQIEMKKSYEAMLQYNQLMQSKFDELENVKKQTGIDHINQQGYLLADPINNPQVFIGETPNDYLDRFFAAPTIALAVTDIIESYVDVTVRLPTFRELILAGNRND